MNGVTQIVVFLTKHQWLLFILHDLLIIGHSRQQLLYNIFWQILYDIYKAVEHYAIIEDCASGTGNILIFKNRFL